MEIYKVKGQFENELISFLSVIDGLTISDELIENASIIYDDKIIGTISYEAFGNLGLIRYFIFRKEAEMDYILKLIENVSYIAKENKIETLFSIVNNDEICQLFQNMGFIELSNKSVYIEEEHIEKTKYKDTKILVFRDNITN